ncbi:cache domain-containing protein [Grimontia sedimenti]|uniref:cache domain-containing protein n=1 Tax=Grimontia sedimenti TaxID=2711294 RepID=UPI001F1EEA95|nr:cache domain-containing protein [Grimontia sedimenti]
MQTIELATQIIDSHYQSDPSEAGREKAMAAIQPLTFGADGYFFAIDKKGIMLAGAKSLLGKDFNSFRDSKGNLLLRDFRRVAQPVEGGFTSYWFPKPGGKEPLEKVSAVKRYEPWGLLIGTGLYVDDLETLVWKETSQAAFLPCVSPLFWCCWQPCSPAC